MSFHQASSGFAGRGAVILAAPRPSAGEIVRRRCPDQWLAATKANMSPRRAMSHEGRPWAHHPRSLRVRARA